jgi:hypothetical protein
VVQAGPGGTDWARRFWRANWKLYPCRGHVADDYVEELVPTMSEETITGTDPASPEAQAEARKAELGEVWEESSG